MWFSYIGMLIACMILSNWLFISGTNYIAHAQLIPQKKATIKPLSVLFTIYGVTSKTGLVVIFAQAHNSSNGQFLNATSIDMADKARNDGIIEILLQLPNLKLKIGQEFQGCVVILNQIKTVCSMGHKSPSDRSEFMDIVL